MTNWRDLTYLRTGTPRQQAAWMAISRHQIIETLRAYDPVLAGTIPLDVDVEESDLDIICTSDNLDQFDADVRAAFGGMEGYRDTRQLVQGVATSVISFYADGFWFELFAQPAATELQNAYRHMVMEARLLELGGAAAYREIRRLKQQGMKTEPAFARYFGITGDDPYVALLELERLTDAELADIVAHTLEPAKRKTPRTF